MKYCPICAERLVSGKVCVCGYNQSTDVENYLSLIDQTTAAPQKSIEQRRTEYRQQQLKAAMAGYDARLDQLQQKMDAQQQQVEAPQPAQTAELKQYHVNAEASKNLEKTKNSREKHKPGKKNALLVVLVLVLCIGIGSAVFNNSDSSAVKQTNGGESQEKVLNTASTADTPLKAQEDTPTDRGNITATDTMLKGIGEAADEQADEDNAYDVQPAVSTDHYELVCDNDCPDYQGQTTLVAYDEQGGELWSFASDYYALTELTTSSTDMGLQTNGYCFEAGGDLYCVDTEAGTLNWKAELVGCPAQEGWAAGPDGTLYIAGFYSPALTVVDIDGQILASYDKFSEEDFHPYIVEYKDGYVEITYESSNRTLIVDPTTGALKQ